MDVKMLRQMTDGYLIAVALRQIRLSKGVTKKKHPEKEERFTCCASTEKKLSIFPNAFEKHIHSYAHLVNQYKLQKDGGIPFLKEAVKYVKRCIKKNNLNIHQGENKLKNALMDCVREDLHKATRQLNLKLD